MAAVAITGATGFLGGALARALLKDRQSVIALGRDAGKLGALKALGAEILAADLSAGAPDCRGLKACALVHCAALSSAWGARAAFEAANIRGTQSAIHAARDLGAARFVHISTPSLYFRFQDQPLVPETTVLPPPVNAYAATKRDAEALVLAAPDLDPIILRPRGIYGQGDTALLPRLLRAARAGPLPLVREGAARTDLTHVDDVVQAVRTALSAPRPGDRVFNISGGEPLAIREIADAAGRHAGVSIRWRNIPSGALLAAARLMEAAARLQPGQPEPRITAYGAGLFTFTQTLDLSAAKVQLGWTPQIRFAEGLERTFRVPA